MSLIVQILFFLNMVGNYGTFKENFPIGSFTHFCGGLGMAAY